MEMIINLVLEMYQVLFVSSVVFLVYILGNFGLKFYGRHFLNRETVFKPTPFEMITLWLSIVIIICFLI